MATVFSHPAVVLGLFPWFRAAATSKAVLMTGVVLSVLPDLDVIGFRLGIPYGHVFGHRGFTHSLFFAVLVSGVSAWLLTRKRRTWCRRTWLFLFLCMASHGIVDTFTNGGYGIALLSPFSNERFFAPWQPIEVSTLSIRHFFAGQGAKVIESEMLWLWTPMAMLFAAGSLWRWRLSLAKPAVSKAE